MKFRKRPIVIEAVQWDGSVDSGVAIKSFAGGYAFINNWNDLTIHNSDRMLHASLGDWVVKEPEGEIYLCKPEIFAARHEQMTT